MTIELTEVKKFDTVDWTYGSAVLETMTIPFSVNLSHNSIVEENIKIAPTPFDKAVSLIGVGYKLHIPGSLEDTEDILASFAMVNSVDTPSPAYADIEGFLIDQKQVRWKNGDPFDDVGFNSKTDTVIFPYGLGLGGPDGEGSSDSLYIIVQPDGTIQSDYTLSGELTLVYYAI